MTEDAKNKLSGTTKFSIDLGSGIIAGFAAAILSHVGFTQIHYLLDLADSSPAC